MTQRSVPRLHVLMRASTPTALVLRQGPSRTFCAIAWNLAKDRFTVGQWVKHKVYSERCDISPDGTWFLYFALDGQWKAPTLGAWTGLAKVPYFTCVEMWPLGNTWGGGGSLENGPHGPTRVHDTIATRLAREGWVDGAKRFGRWTLRKKLPGMGFVQKHELIGEETYDRSAWQWAEVDAPRKRLVFAEAGRICSVPLARPLSEPKLLFDANGMTFEAIAAPYATPKMPTPRSAGGASIEAKGGRKKR